KTTPEPAFTVKVVVLSTPLTTTPGPSSRALTVFEVVASLADSLTLLAGPAAARLVTYAEAGSAVTARPVALPTSVAKSSPAGADERQGGVGEGDGGLVGQAVGEVLRARVVEPQRRPLADGDRVGVVQQGAAVLEQQGAAVVADGGGAGVGVGAAQRERAE